MPHMTRQQEKAMFAKKGNSSTRSNINPTIREKIAGIKEALRKRKERKGLERIEAEKLAFEREKVTEKRLEAELKVEQARETVALQRAKTQAEFKEIEAARRERKLAPIRKRFKEITEIGRKVGKVAEKAARPKKRKKKVEETGFFGI